MKRDMKFRAWDGERFTFWGFGVMLGAFAGPASTGKGNPMTMIQQQFTGLKDKNGREIYEGDIVKTQAYRDRPYSKKYTKKRHIGVVEYSIGSSDSFQNPITKEWNRHVDYSAEWCVKKPNGSLDKWGCGVWGDFFDCEVIGNIYENPELLEPK